MNRGGVKPLDLNYSYDPRKLVTSIIDGAVSNNNRYMTYDGLERLITASGPWGQGTFSYDSLGNIRTKNLGSRRVTINYDSNLLVTQSIDTGGLGGSTGVRSFRHDDRGNIDIAGALTFTYDYADQPITVTGAQQGVYQYDGNFKRVKNTVGGDTIYNVYTQSGQLAHVHNISKNERTDYVKLGSLSVASVKNGTPTYLHHDQLGTAVAATNTSAGIIWTKRYTPFGIGLDNNSSNDDQAGYTGHIEDDDTGLVYMQARYYDPVIGRFYSNDRLGAMSHLEKTNGTQGFNRYNYTYNNPYKYIDPDGNEPKTPTTTVQLNGKPLTLEGPYKPAPTLAEKGSRFALSKAVVEKFSGKLFKVDLLTGAIVSNPVGLGLSMLINPSELGDGSCSGIGDCSTLFEGANPNFDVSIFEPQSENGNNTEDDNGTQVFYKTQNPWKEWDWDFDRFERSRGI